MNKNNKDLIKHLMTSKKRSEAVRRKRHDKKNRLSKSKAIKHIDFLSLLAKAKSKKQRAKLLELANNSQISSIMECISNVNKGNVKIPPATIPKLKRYSGLVRKLYEKGSANVKSRKRILTEQGGGFLGSLIPLAVSAISSLIGGLAGQ